MHRRQAIAQVVVAALRAEPTMPPVSLGRVYLEDESALPVVDVVLGAESLIAETTAAGADYVDQRREMEIEIAVYATAESEVDYAAEAVALIVERTLAPLGLGDPAARVGGFADTFRYTGAEEPERSGDTSRPLIRRALTYRVTYEVDAQDPQ